MHVLEHPADGWREQVVCIEKVVQATSDSPDWAVARTDCAEICGTIHGRAGVQVVQSQWDYRRWCVFGVVVGAEKVGAL